MQPTGHEIFIVRFGKYVGRQEKESILMSVDIVTGLSQSSEGFPELSHYIVNPLFAWFLT